MNHMFESLSIKYKTISQDTIIHKGVEKVAMVFDFMNILTCKHHKYHSMQSFVLYLSL
jgi:hypothetical protein